MSVNMGIVGLGDIAQKAYLPIVASHKKLSPWFCTRNPSQLNALTKQYRPEKNMADLDLLIAEKPDGIMIHSATSAHYQQVKKVIDAGIPCFVDKPFSFNADELLEISSLAKQQNIPLMIGFNRPFTPMVCQLNVSEANHINWQKNRNNLFHSVEQTVFDDFIHVIHGLVVMMLEANQKVTMPKIYAQKNHQGLKMVAIEWQFENLLVQGSMNRGAALTKETIQVDGKQAVLLENLNKTLYHSGNDVTFNDWTPTLEKRGFVQMIDHWVEQVEQFKAGKFKPNPLSEADLISHQIAQSICDAISD